MSRTIFGSVTLIFCLLLNILARAEDPAHAAQRMEQAADSALKAEQKAKDPALKRRLAMQTFAYKLVACDMEEETPLGTNSKIMQLCALMRATLKKDFSEDEQFDIESMMNRLRMSTLKLNVPPSVRDLNGHFDLERTAASLSASASSAYATIRASCRSKTIKREPAPSLAPVEFSIRLPMLVFPTKMGSDFRSRTLIISYPRTIIDSITSP